MKIGIDIRCLEEGRKTGVEEYALNLLTNIFELDKENEYVLFLNSLKGKSLDLEWIKKYPNARIKSFRYPNKFFNLFVWYFNWPKIDSLIRGVDVFWMPNINFGSFSKKTKLILTVHDLSFEIFPEYFPWKTRLWHFLINPKKLCQKASKIIAVSDSTKKDLSFYYGVNPQKITAIHSAASGSFGLIDRNNTRLLEIKDNYNLPYYFILFLGAMEPRKNIASIVKAYNQLRKLKNQDLDKFKLVIAGAKGWKEKKIFEEIESSPFRKDILELGFIEADEKPYLYNLASLFVYPSFFEGFGFPPLEAMNCGVPVIVSNNSSLPEIVGDAGILIDPEKPDEIYQAMKEILLNKNLRNKLREKGLKQAQKFNWQKTAEEFLEVINNIAV
ncbi:MAG: glycosyltransferase family 1 protein [Patescibacteria group bacterium]